MKIDHRALDASDVAVPDHCQQHQCRHQSLNGMWDSTWRSHTAFGGVRGLSNSLTCSPSSAPSLSQSMSGSSSASGLTWASSTPLRSTSTTLHSRAKPSLLTGLMVCPSSLTQTPGLRRAGENPASYWLRLS